MSSILQLIRCFSSILKTFVLVILAVEFLYAHHKCCFPPWWYIIELYGEFFLAVYDLYIFILYIKHIKQNYTWSINVISGNGLVLYLFCFHDNFPLLVHLHMDFQGSSSKLQINTYLLQNMQRFPVFRFAYFLLWTAAFVISQWIIHACVSIW